MYSKLVEDTTKRNYIDEVQVFNPSDNGGLWECPFCDPGASTGVYRLKVPSKTDIEERKHVRLLIKNHVELHQKDLLSQMTDEKNDLQIDRARSESMKRVRLWITGTINDRKLYEE